MKKNNLILFAAIGGAAYFLYKKFGSGNFEPGSDKQLDSSLDQPMEKTMVAEAGKVSETIAKATDFVNAIDNAIVNVKLPKGNSVRIGRRKDLKKKRKAKKLVTRAKRPKKVKRVKRVRKVKKVTND
tara:strand:+ start:1181 stop:1561 length:381 start_codon:yes stop_codon:yes gene_type:complete